MRLEELKGVVIVEISLDSYKGSDLSETKIRAEELAKETLKPLKVESSLIGPIQDGKMEVVCKI